MKETFFKAVSVREFLDLLFSFPVLHKEENIDLEDACARVLSQDLFSAEDLPMKTRSSMDGYAVSAIDTFGASEGSPAYLEIRGRVKIEQAPDFQIMPGECAEITTGGALPKGADSVVMVEYTLAMGNTIEITRSVAPGENVILKGEDASTGEPVFPKGHRLRAQDVGLLAALGHHSIPVFARPGVFIISTGNELVPVRSVPRPGEIRDVNTYTLRAIVEQAGSRPIPGGIVRDDLQQLTDALNRGVETADLVLVSGGSSVGMRDFTLEAISNLPDSAVLAHGVSMKPGKPNILARAGGTPVWGLPGQVTSSQVSILALGIPFLRHLGGESIPAEWGSNMKMAGRLTKNISSPQGKTEFIRVRIQETTEGAIPEITPVYGRSGLLKTLIQGDGLLCVPSEREGMETGEIVQVQPF